MEAGVPPAPSLAQGMGPSRWAGAEEEPSVVYSSCSLDVWPAHSAAE